MIFPPLHSFTFKKKILERKTPIKFPLVISDYSKELIPSLSPLQLSVFINSCLKHLGSTENPWIPI
jgi:hypothetical protein